MTNKERAYNLLHYKGVDRMPAVHFGYWPELLVEWAEQGHIDMDLARSWSDGSPVDRILDEKLGWDFNWYTVVSPNNGLNPPFEYKVLERLPDGFVRVQNYEGQVRDRYHFARLRRRNGETFAHVVRKRREYHVPHRGGHVGRSVRARAQKVRQGNAGRRRNG